MELGEQRDVGPLADAPLRGGEELRDSLGAGLRPLGAGGRAPRDEEPFRLATRLVRATAISVVELPTSTPATST